jgi:hypothetical protein
MPRGWRASSPSTGMAKPCSARPQLATRLPASLLQRVKIFCVERDVRMMDFVEEALREKLKRVRRP